MRYKLISASIILSTLVPFIAYAGVVKQTKSVKQSAVNSGTKKDEKQKKVTNMKAHHQARINAVESARKMHRATVDTARTQYTIALKAAKAARSKSQMKEAKNVFEEAKKTANEKLKAALDAAKVMQ